MVGIHPSMPNMLDGCKILAQTNWRGELGVWTQGEITKAPSGWGEEEEMCLPLKIPEGLNFLTKEGLLFWSFVLYIVNGKRGCGWRLL